MTLRGLLVFCGVFLWGLPVIAQEGDVTSNGDWRGAGARWAGPLSAAAIDATVTARDERSWRILWQMIGEDPPGPLPDGRMAISIFQRPEEGPTRELEITEVVAGETALVIGFRERSTEADEANEAETEGGETEAISAPYVVRLVPVSLLPVYYVGTVERAR
ncbi:MAG: hypothetical protein AAGF58_00650 [Pseudomonadota bacterium]